MICSAYYNHQGNFSLHIIRLFFIFTAFQFSFLRCARHEVQLVCMFLLPVLRVNAGTDLMPVHNNRCLEMNAEILKHYTCTDRYGYIAVLRHREVNIKMCTSLHICCKGCEETHPVHTLQTDEYDEIINITIVRKRQQSDKGFFWLL